MKIFLRLVLSFVCIGLIVLITISPIFYTLGSNALDKRIEAQLHSISILKENQLNNFIGEKIEYVERIDNNEFLVNNLSELLTTNLGKEGDIDHNMVEESFKKRLREYEDIVEFSMLDLDGKIHISTNEIQEGKIKSNEEYFIEGKYKTFLNSFYYDLELQEPAMAISTPLKDEGGNVVGVLAVKVDIEKISEIMIERSGFGETGETILVNKFNYLVSPSRFIAGLEYKKAIYTETVQNCLKGNSGYGHYDDYRGIRVLGKYTWISKHNVCLIAEIDENEAFASVKALRILIIAISAVLTCIILFFGIFLSHSVLNPVIKLTKNIEEISLGKMDVRVEGTERNDETGALAKAFDRILVSLKLAMKMTAPELKKEGMSLKN
jgi:HAMP domain-containing protein